MNAPLLLCPGGPLELLFALIATAVMWLVPFGVGVGFLAALVGLAREFRRNG
ncbi:MAG: hypothetical protein ACRD68_06300 [Pyrinomonadaceae bacterium]